MKGHGVVGSQITCTPFMMIKDLQRLSCRRILRKSALAFLVAALNFDKAKCQGSRGIIKSVRQRASPLSSLLIYLRTPLQLTFMWSWWMETVQWLWLHTAPSCCPAALSTPLWIYSACSCDLLGWLGLLHLMIIYNLIELLKKKSNLIKSARGSRPPSVCVSC